MKWTVKANVLFSGRFAAKFELVFVLTWKTLFLRGSILKPTERTEAFLKSGTRDFQNSLPFEKSACFYVAVSENFELFRFFNFEANFLVKENWSTVF